MLARFYPVRPITGLNGITPKRILVEGTVCTYMVIKYIN